MQTQVGLVLLLLLLLLLLLGACGVTVVALVSLASFFLQGSTVCPSVPQNPNGMSFFGHWCFSCALSSQHLHGSLLLRNQHTDSWWPVLLQVSHGGFRVIDSAAPLAWWQYVR